MACEDSMRRAIALAEEAFCSVGVDFETMEYLNLVDRVQSLKISPVPQPPIDEEVNRMLREFELSGD